MPVKYIARISFKSLKNALTKSLLFKTFVKSPWSIAFTLQYSTFNWNFRTYSHYTARVDRVHTKQQFWSCANHSHTNFRQLRKEFRRNIVFSFTDGNGFLNYLLSRFKVDIIYRRPSSWNEFFNLYSWRYLL